MFVCLFPWRSRFCYHFYLVILHLCRSSMFNCRYVCVFFMSFDFLIVRLSVFYRFFLVCLSVYICFVFLKSHMLVGRFFLHLVFTILYVRLFVDMSLFVCSFDFRLSIYNCVCLSVFYPRHLSLSILLHASMLFV